MIRQSISHVVIDQSSASLSIMQSIIHATVNQSSAIHSIKQAIICVTIDQPVDKTISWLIYQLTDQLIDQASKLV